MDILSFSHTLKEILQKGPLPGHEAQLIMASDFYRGKNIDLVNLSGYKKSAVCLLFYEKKDKIHFLLIKRPNTHRHHAGQIALPGGSCDEGESFEKTALRELFEETGIEIGPQNLIGKLSPFYIPISNFYIQPQVAFIDKEFTLMSGPEVEQYIEFTLEELLNDSIIAETEIITQGGKLKLKTPYFNVQGFVMWGATAMMLSELKELLKQHRATFSFLFQ